MLQIIGTNQSKDYQKAVRFCKERRINFQEINTKLYKLSKKELDSIFSSLDSPFLVIDTHSQYYKKNGYEWREYSPREEVEEHQELLINPILRSGNKCCLGFSDDFIKENS